MVPGNIILMHLFRTCKPRVLLFPASENHCQGVYFSPSRPVHPEFKAVSVTNYSLCSRGNVNVMSEGSSFVCGSVMSV